MRGSGGAQLTGGAGLNGPGRMAQALRGCAAQGVVGVKGCTPGGAWFQGYATQGGAGVHVRACR